MTTPLSAALVTLLLAVPPGLETPAGLRCAGKLDRRAVVDCALAKNPEVRRTRLELDALAGQRIVAGTWLPSNPSLQLQAGRRDPLGSLGIQPGLNWSATLSQQLEIAGQRGARLEQVDAATSAALRRVVVAEREVTAAALAAYYELVTAKQGQVLAQSVAQVASVMGSLAQARAQEALLAPVDADVARAESVRMILAVSEADRRLAVAQATLQILLDAGDEAAVDVAPDMEPLALPDEFSHDDAGPLLAQALRLRGEIVATETEGKVLEHQISLLRRERIPNLTASLFANQDYATERVVGGGLSFPITLPAPVGHSRAGEITEILARIEQVKADVELVRRRVRQDVARALSSERMTTRALALFEPEHLQRAQRDLTALGEALAARQLTMREALLAQRSLIELLQAHLGVQLAHALARVELIRAAGLPFAGVTP